MPGKPQPKPPKLTLEKLKELQKKVKGWESRPPREFVLQFGKYKGRKLGSIANFDKGLLYLDWLLGWIEENKDKAERWKNLYLNLTIVLTEPKVTARLLSAIEDASHPAVHFRDDDDRATYPFEEADEWDR